MLGLMLAVAIVDQIDAPGALLELDPEHLVMVDTRCLPPSVEEGDRVQVLLREAGRCPTRGLWRRR